MLSRKDGPVWMTRLAMRPAKSFWKNAQDCRTTCQWLCQRTRLVMPAAMAWLVMRFCENRLSGRISNKNPAMAASCGHESWKKFSGVWELTSPATRPIMAGMRASHTATNSPTTNNATIRPRTCLT